MPDFTVNHVSMATVPYAPLLAQASALRYVGVEVLSDSEGTLFNDTTPEYTAESQSRNLRVHALAQVCAIDDYSPARCDEARQHDRLCNPGQVSRLCSKGDTGPVSMGACSPDIHALNDPQTALHDSFKFIAFSQAAQST